MNYDENKINDLIEMWTNTKDENLKNHIFMLLIAVKNDLK